MSAYRKSSKTHEAKPAKQKGETGKMYNHREHYQTLNWWQRTKKKNEKSPNNNILIGTWGMPHPRNSEYVFGWEWNSHQDKEYARE